jgi:hypothetical protein
MLGDRCLPELMSRASLSGRGTSTLAELLVRAIRDGNREARDTIHLEYAYLESHYLQAHSRQPGGMIPLSRLLIDARPAVFDLR